MAGKVYLVGAGPGGLGCLTLQAQALLSQADVVIYDALVDPALLTLASKGCLCLNVGKRGGESSVPQPQINQLLVEYCQKGRQVVRLKSGDPLVFGRGMMEIEALQAANCEFELVPGLSSALVAPLLAGIPLTHPHLSRCFAVLTAHAPQELEWRALARLETLVILMAGHQLPEIVLHLQDYGKPAHTPVAVVRWASRPQQKIWRGTLATIQEKIAGEDLSPAVVIVGAVAELEVMPPISQAPTSIPAQPLAQTQILVTRSVEQSPEFTQQLQRWGAEVLEMPALEIVPPSSWADLDAAIEELDQFDWLILTSANGVDAFMARLWANGKDSRSLRGVKIAVVGRKTATSLEQKGLRPDFIPTNFVADALVAEFPEFIAGKKLLFPRVETGGRETLVAELRQQGARVVEVAAYESRCPKHLAPEIVQSLELQMIDWVTFASSKTVQNFCQLLKQAAPQTWQTWLHSVKIASIGPQTSRTCQELLGRVDVEATEYTLEGLTAAIVAATRTNA
jgi:uroporphyrinogen III methyltransferase/synthase